MNTITEDFLFESFKLIESLTCILHSFKNNPQKIDSQQILKPLKVLNRYANFLNYSHLSSQIKNLIDTISGNPLNQKQITPLLKALDLIVHSLCNPKENQAQTSITQPLQGHLSFLGFLLDKKNFALPLLEIQEVTLLPHYTPLPQAPDYLLGTFEFSQQQTPLIDLRIRFNLPHQPIHSYTKVIIIKPTQDSKVQVGLIIDCLTPIFQLQPDEFIQNPNKHPIIQGISKKDGQLITILNPKFLCNLVQFQS